MRTRVRAVGNSLGVILPKSSLGALGVSPGDALFIKTTPEGLLLSRSPRDPRIAAFLGSVHPMLGKEVLLVHTFGSYGTNRFREGESDIDLYIVVRDERLRVAEAGLVRAAGDVNAGAEGFSKLSLLVVPESRFDRGWFKYEVTPGVQLYAAKEWNTTELLGKRPSAG